MAIFREEQRAGTFMVDIIPFIFVLRLMARDNTSVTRINSSVDNGHPLTNP